MGKINKNIPFIAYNQLDKALVDKSARIVDSSGVMDMIEKWRIVDGYDKNKGGRPRYIPLRSALIIMLVLGIQSQPHHITRGRDILCYQTTKNAWDALGLPVDDFKNRQDHLESSRWYDRLWKSVHVILDVFNPYPEASFKRRYSKDEYEELAATRNKNLIIQRKARGTVFANALIHASVKLFGEDKLTSWDGSVVVDGTPVEVAKRGLYKDSSRMPSTPMAGWYRRDGDHKADESTPDKFMWGFEVTLAAMVGNGFGGQGKYPSLVAGMSMDKPGHRIAENAMAALERQINDPDSPRGSFIGDRAYIPGAKAEKLQIPLRQAGFSLVGDLREDSHGVKDNYEGAVQIDGSWYCPVVEMLPGFVNPQAALRSGEIDEERFDEIIEQRQVLALRVKETREDGSQKFQCPARGTSPTAVCPLVRNKKADGKALFPIPKKMVPKKIDQGKVCTNKDSIIVPIERGAKFAQQGPAWGTAEWKKAYQPPRATIESRNDLLKNARGAGIGDSTTRLVRGWAAQLFSVAIGVVAVNVRLIASWLSGQDTDDPGHEPVPPSDDPWKDMSLRDVADANAPPMAA